MDNVKTYSWEEALELGMTESNMISLEEAKNGLLVPEESNFDQEQVNE